MPDLREVEYDTFNGITKRWYFDGDKIVCHKSVDLTDLVDYCKNQSRDTHSFIGSKTKYHKVVSLHPMAQYEILKKYNLDVFSSDTNDQKMLYRIIESDYPHLKTYSGKLYRPVSLKNKCQS